MREWSGSDPSNWPTTGIGHDIEDNLMRKNVWGLFLIDVRVLHDGPPHIRPQVPSCDFLEDWDE